MTKLLTAMTEGAERLFRKHIVESKSKRAPRAKQPKQLELVGPAKPRKKAARKRKRAAGWENDPVLAPAVEFFPDNRLGLWVSHRLRTPQDKQLKRHWSYAYKEKQRMIENFAQSFGLLERELMKRERALSERVGREFSRSRARLNPAAIAEVWLVQVAPSPDRDFFDGDNLGGAFKAGQDAIARYLGVDDASHKLGTIRWRHGWYKSAGNYGALAVFMGAAEGGQWDHVVDGHVEIPREGDGVLRLNMRDEFRDTR